MNNETKEGKMTKSNEVDQAKLNAKEALECAYGIDGITPVLAAISEFLGDRLKADLDQDVIKFWNGMVKKHHKIIV